MCMCVCVNFQGKIHNIIRFQEKLVTPKMVKNYWQKISLGEKKCLALGLFQSHPFTGGEMRTWGKDLLEVCSFLKFSLPHPHPLHYFFQNASVSIRRYQEMPRAWLQWQGVNYELFVSLPEKGLTVSEHNTQTKKNPFGFGNSQTLLGKWGTGLECSGKIMGDGLETGCLLKRFGVLGKEGQDLWEWVH